MHQRFNTQKLTKTSYQTICKLSTTHELITIMDSKDFEHDIQCVKIRVNSMEF